MEALIGFIAFLMAVLVGYTTSQFAAIADPSVAGRLKNIDQPAVPRDAFAVVGRPLLRILPTAFKRIELDLYWAAFTTPSWASRTPAWIVGRQVLMAAALGVLTAWVLRTSLGLWIGGLLGWTLMRADLVARASLVRKRISQELPEFLQLMAAESASGANLETVLMRAAQGEGTLPVWLRRVLAMAHGRSLLPGGETAAGVLLEESQRSGHPDLISFAIQMGFTRQGTQVKETLTRLATQFSDTYIGQAEIRTEQLANTLGILVAVFYFLPFMIVILLVVGVPLIKAF
ncbi:MAG TPA: type II secretion system F family protein [Anaerolineaceae bacterium]|jgi:Flp pilus assembly protein TadB